MKKLSCLLLFTMVFVGASWAEEPVDSKPKAYVLHPGDTVQIMVWKDESLQKELKVLPDGFVTFPLAGRIKLAGMGVAEAEQAIAAKLMQYMPEPVVTVVVTGIEGNKAFLVGNVAVPGPKVMAGPTNVLQAISLAGGLSKFAKTTEIKLVRQVDGQSQVLAINYEDIATGRDMSTNYELKAGDTILVP